MNLTVRSAECRVQSGGGSPKAQSSCFTPRVAMGVRTSLGIESRGQINDSMCLSLSWQGL